jgi:hypothetical protein
MTGENEPTQRPTAPDEQAPQPIAPDDQPSPVAAATPGYRPTSTRLAEDRQIAARQPPLASEPVNTQREEPQPEEPQSAQLVPSARAATRRRTPRAGALIAAGFAAGGVTVVAVGGVSLAAQLYGESIRLPQSDVQQQVTRVLQQDYLVPVTEIRCPDRIGGWRGTTFVCTYKTSLNRSGNVTITITDTNGSLQVQPPA